MFTQQFKTSLSKYVKINQLKYLKVHLHNNLKQVYQNM